MLREISPGNIYHMYGNATAADFQMQHRSSAQNMQMQVH